MLINDYYYIRFEKESQHYAIMCYVPLIGLCTYPERHNSFSNILIAPDSNPFIKIALGVRPEFEDPSNAIIRSAFFRAIVKYKWHAFARWRYFGLFLCHLINSCLFTVVVTINATNIRSTTETLNYMTININRKLIILCIILETLQTLFFVRCAIILYVRRLLHDIDYKIWFLSVIPVFSVITVILEYNLLNLFLSFDVQEQFFTDHVSRYLNILPYFRSVSCLLTWMSIFVYLIVLFKKSGFFFLGKSLNSQKYNYLKISISLFKTYLLYSCSECYR